MIRAKVYKAFYKPPKYIISFFFIQQEALGNLSSSTNGDKSGIRRHSEDSKTKSSAAVVSSNTAGSSRPSLPLPVPVPVVNTATTPTGGSVETKESSDVSGEPAKKPDWLAELSRKQANRR